MNLKRPIGVFLTLFALQSEAPASAQATSTIEGLSLAGTLVNLTGPVGSGASGRAIALSTAIEVATAPLGTSSAGFAFELDPATGLQVRTASTFGPAFGDRVLTMGAGKMSAAANLIVATYDRLGDFHLDKMQLSRFNSSSPSVARSGMASLVMSSQTMVFNGAMGVTDSLDVSVAIPMVKVKLDGLSWVETDAGQVVLQAGGAGVASGLGDIALLAKYRLMRFGEGNPDPGGVALVGTMRLPTGDKENLRGLGITRTLASIVVSSGRGSFRPHGTAGFEFWSKGIDVEADFAGTSTVTARHQVQYTGGIEYEATPKLTLIGDIVGRHILGGGRIGPQLFSSRDPRVTSVEAVVALPQGFHKLALAPGLKWNVKGTVLLSLNALVPLFDQGLYDRFTPVIGLDWTF